MAKNGSVGVNIALAGRVKRIEAELAAEKLKRRLAEQKLAGTKSALLRLQAVIARQRATDAERRAKHA
jgi:hypothetical protein